MEVDAKRVLLNMMYYTLIGLTFVFGVLFLVTMTSKGAAMWQQIIYYVWTIVLLGTLVLDIIYTIMGRMKFISGLIIYCLSVLCVIVGFIVFGFMNVAGVIAAGNIYMFSVLICFSLGLTITSIIIFCAGEKIVEYNE